MFLSENLSIYLTLKNKKGLQCILRFTLKSGEFRIVCACVATCFQSTNKCTYRSPHTPLHIEVYLVYGDWKQAIVQD